jgi:Tat protein secretion system quality control protein TatD with DNase activity
MQKNGLGDVEFIVKERNESCVIEEGALVVAGLNDMSVDEVADHAWRNYKRIFFTTGD